VRWKRERWRVVVVVVILGAYSDVLVVDVVARTQSCIACTANSARVRASANYLDVVGW
jgi:hypothetical protein